MTTFMHRDRRLKSLLAALEQLSVRHRSDLPVDGFPTATLAVLREKGGLCAPVPRALGGLGLGTEPGQGLATAAALYAVGSVDLSLGRIWEGHLNALRLVVRNGEAAQQAAAAHDAIAGELFALWVTDAVDRGLHYTRSDAGIVLHGAKQFCSAAGYATRAVVTAQDENNDTRMLVLTLGSGERVVPLDTGLHGMRGASTGKVDFEGVSAPADAVFGLPGAYLREPDFSTGAWRASAVAAGGLAALVETTRRELVGRRRASQPHQAARLGAAFVASETARLWVREVAAVAEDADADPSRAVALVGLARTAVENACLDVIRLVQRSLGLSAFLDTNPVERLIRDLSTYLRQPAGDEVLTEAAAYFAAHPPLGNLQ